MIDLVERISALEAQRVFFLANDPRLEDRALTAITERDVIVQFNDVQHFAKVADVKAWKLIVYNFREPDGQWGFSSDRPTVDPFRQAFKVPLNFIFLGGLSTDARSFADSLDPGPTVVQFDAMRTFPYPVDRRMSAGYAAVCLFKLANVLREIAGRPRFSLYPIGFTGRYPNKLGSLRHDFDFEVTVLRNWPDVHILDFAGQPYAQSNRRDPRQDWAFAEVFKSGRSYRNNQRADLLRDIAVVHIRTGDLDSARSAIEEALAERPGAPGLLGLQKHISKLAGS